jgi:hypothetical protein
MFILSYETVTTTALLLIALFLVALYLYTPGAVPAGTVNTTFPFESAIKPPNMDAPAAGGALPLFGLTAETVKTADWPAAKETEAGLARR